MLGGAEDSARSSSSKLLAAAVNFSLIVTVPTTLAPAVCSIAATPDAAVLTSSSPSPTLTSSTLRLVSLPPSSIGAASVAKPALFFSSARDWSRSSRSCWFSPVILLTWSLRFSASGPFAAAVPTTRPMASARKTAASDTTWYRKLITAQNARLGEQREDQVVPPLGD